MCYKQSHFLSKFLRELHVHVENSHTLFYLNYMKEALTCSVIVKGDDNWKISWKVYKNHSISQSQVVSTSDPNLNDYSKGRFLCEFIEMIGSRFIYFF